MVDPYTRARFGDGEDPGLGGELFSYAVTRRDRAPDQHDRAHEKVALKLEELAASIGSDVPPALREVFDPSEPEVQTSIFTALTAEALGIVRERAPEAYDEFIAGLLTCDKRLAPARARLAVEALDIARKGGIPVDVPPPPLRQVKVRWAAIGFTAALCLWNVAIIGNGIWGSSRALAAPSSYQAYQSTLHRP